MISFSDFEKVDIRVGTVIAVNDFPEARKKAYQLEIDFGPLGILQSSAQITKRYTKEDVLHKQVLAVVNLGVKKIAHFESQCLVLGATQGDDVILLSPESPLPIGQAVQ